MNEIDDKWSELWRPSNLDSMIVKHSDSASDPFSDAASGYFVPEIKAHLDMFSLKNLYFSEPWVYSFCNIIARKVSRQLMGTHFEKIINGEITDRPALGHDLMKMIERPNEHEAYTSFMYKVASELALMGNAVIWKMRFHKKLMILPTELITIDFDNNDCLASYNLNGAISPELNCNMKGNIRIHPEDIIHIRLPNVNSMIWGLSPFIPAKKSVLFDRYSTEYLLNFYLKQANPGPVIEMDKDANEKSAFRFLKSMEVYWTGRENQRRTMVLPKGVSAKTLAHKISEQELKEHILLKRDELRAVYNIPPHELGLQQAGSIGSEETKQQLVNFWDSTIIPFQDIISDGFNIGFEKALLGKFFFKFDNSNVSVLQESFKDKAETGDKMLSTHTVNEVRKILYNAGPTPGGDKSPAERDKPQQVAGQVPMQLPAAADKPEPVVEEEEKGLFKPKVLDLLKASNPEWWIKRKQFEVTATEGERQMRQETLNVFADMAPVSILAFQDVFNGVDTSTRTLQGKFRIKADSNEEKLKELVERLDRAFNDFETVWLNSTTPTLQGTSEFGYDLQLNVPFNLPNEDAIQALKIQNEAARLAVLEARGIESFKNISNTTTNEIVAVVERGLTNNKTIAQISQDIQTYYRDIIPSRAKTIARTESLTAVSLGQDAAFQDAEKVIPGLRKLWMTAGDPRVRDSHELLDGTTAKKGEKFSNGLKFPRDPSGEAAEVINCRCTWLMLLPEDEDPTLPDNPKKVTS